MSSSNMISSKAKWTAELLKYVAEKTAESTSLESWIHWTKRFLDEHKDCCYTPNTLIGYAQTALKTDEDLPYLDMMQKVQLLFVFSLKVSEKFEKMLLDQGCKIKLDDRRRMAYFQSADGSFERSANHQNHLGRKPNKKDPQPPLQPTNGQSTSAAGEPRASNVEARQNQHRGENPVEEKPDVFDAPAEGYEDQEELLRAEQRGYRRDEAPVKEEYVFTDEQRQAIEYYIRANFHFGIDIDTRRDIESKFANGQLLFQFIPRVEDDFEIIMRADEPTTSTKRRQFTMPTEAKRSKQDDNGASTSGLMRNSGTMLENFERRPTTSTSLRPVVAIPLRSSTSTPKVTPTPSEASMTSVIASSSVKISKQDAVTQTCSALSMTSTQAIQTDPLPEIKSISALQLTQQIEALAETFGFSELENKAAQIGGRIEDQTKTIKHKKFNIIVMGVLTTLEGEAVEYCDGESMMLKTLFKRIRNTLLRPLGKEIVTKALELINKKIENLEKESSKGVVPMDLIQENLELILELHN